MRFDVLMLLSCLLSLIYLTIMFFFKKEKFDIRDMKKGMSIYITAIFIVLAPIIVTPDLNFDFKLLVIAVGVIIFFSNFSLVRGIRKLRGFDEDKNR